MGNWCFTVVIARVWFVQGGVSGEWIREEGSATPSKPESQTMVKVFANTREQNDKTLP